MKILAVSPESDYAEEATCIIRLLENGLARYHLRKPNWAVEQTADLLHKLPEEWLPRLSIHQHHQLAESFPVGVHYKDTKVGKWILPSVQASISRSLHSIEGLSEASAGMDYVFLSPVFASISKVNHSPSWSDDTIRAVLSQERSTEIFGLGGINADTIEEAIGLGFDGVVVHGALWQSLDPLAVFSQFGRISV
ncbi:MAG: thiamine phosphate synthase [Coraliomargaritaceae bacterium]